MARFLRKWRPAVLTILILGALYFATRLINLTILPIFTDEAIYIRWSQIGSRDAAWRFISLVDGKQPLFTWIMMVVLRIVDDPLLAGRLVSVFSGAATTVGMWAVAQELFKSRKTAVVSSFLYILIPFGLMYDRMALYDSLSGALSIWSLYLAILLVRRVRLDVSLLLGMSLGLGILNKTSGFLSLYMLPATLLLLREKKKFWKWVGFVIISSVLSLLMYSVLRLSPLFAMVGQKDTVFVYSIKEWLTHPFNFLLGNLRGLFDWQIHYLTWPIFTTAILSGISLWKWTREKMLLLVWWFAPLLALAAVGRVLYPRFILFMSLPLIILAAAAVVWVWERFRTSVWRWVALCIFFASSVYTDFYIITNPLYAPIPQADAGQYIDDWPSGWGIRQVNTFLEQEAKKGKISIFTDGTFGLLPYAIEIYHVDNPNIKIKGMYPIAELSPDELIRDAKDHPTYVLFNQAQTIPPWPLTLIAEYQKGKRTDKQMRLYQVTP